MQALERVIPVARQLLTLQLSDEQRDYWLWERAERVMNLTQLVARIPEVAEHSIDLTALGVAGLFHCAGWVSQTQHTRLPRWKLLARPTNDIQRELGAVLLQEHAAHLLMPRVARLAAEAVRQCNDRETSLIEAQLLAEAENLDDVGAMCILRQFRQYQIEGHPLRQLVATWERQQEYRYWEVRVNDGLRFETTRRLARERLKAVEVFMRALARDLEGADLAESLEQSGIETPSRPRSTDQPVGDPSG